MKKKTTRTTKPALEKLSYEKTEEEVRASVAAEVKSYFAIENIKKHHAEM